MLDHPALPSARLLIGCIRQNLPLPLLLPCSFQYNDPHPALGCKFPLTQAISGVCVHAKMLPSCLTLCNPMDCRPPGSPFHGILQERILKWVAMPSSRGSFWLRYRTCFSYVTFIVRRVFLITNNTLEGWLFLELSPISLSHCKTLESQFLFLSQWHRLQNILFAIIYKCHWIYIYIFSLTASNHLVLAMSSNIQALPRYWGKKFPESLSPITSISICCLLSIWFPQMLSYLVYNALIINQFVFAI